MYQHYPVVIFCYNRPKKLNNLIKSIKKNSNFKKHKYFFFCDGANKERNFKLVKKNIKIIKKLKNIRKKIILRNQNYGLSKNIIEGVSYVLKKNNSCIVLEDDLILEKDCLHFINFGLNKFKDNKKIGSISGYSYVHNEQMYNNLTWFKLYRHCSWAWGTWKDVWNKIDWNIKNTNIEKIKKLRKNSQFAKAGEDIVEMLIAQKYKLINSWAVRFNYHCLKKKLISVSPRFSQVSNDGYGLGATHTLNIFNKQKINFKENNLKNLNKVKSPKLNYKLNELIKKKHNSSKKLKFKILIKKIISNYF
ncbi:glycosyltransferase [Candidatus Pelagibacter sp. HIMB1521]|uniref:glycosyltransferase n=1 Tax=Candidatus Pelagibacter sp. HIMB1521 TaxID=3413344 RepID=UPI003F82CA8F